MLPLEGEMYKQSRVQNGVSIFLGATFAIRCAKKINR